MGSLGAQFSIDTARTSKFVSFAAQNYKLTCNVNACRMKILDTTQVLRRIRNGASKRSGRLVCIVQNEREASPFRPALHLAVIIDDSEKVTTSDSCFVRSELVLLFFYITPNAISSYGIGSLNQ